MRIYSVKIRLSKNRLSARSETEIEVNGQIPLFQVIVRAFVKRVRDHRFANRKLTEGTCDSQRVDCHTSIADRSQRICGPNEDRIRPMRS